MTTVKKNCGHVSMAVYPNNKFAFEALTKTFEEYYLTFRLL